MNFSVVSFKLRHYQFLRRLHDDRGRNDDTQGHGHLTNSKHAQLGEPLTEREASVCALLTAGESAKEAAAALGISHRTVETHKWRIFKKFGVDNIVKLTRIVLLREKEKA